VSDTDPGARKGFPVAEKLQRGTLPGYVPLLRSVPLSTGKRLVAAGAQASEKWGYMGACKKS